MKNLKFEIDLKHYPKNALYATAYCFLDEVYISLVMESAAKDSEKKDIATVMFEKNEHNELDLRDIKKRFLKELAYSAIRNGLFKKNRKVREAIVAQALFSAIGGFGKAENCEDALITEEEKSSKNMENDPLGISLAWEDKYAKI